MLTFLNRDIMSEGIPFDIYMTLITLNVGKINM